MHVCPSCQVSSFCVNVAHLHLQILEKEVFPLLTGFYDTPFITWLLKTEQKYNSKVFFEDQLGINRHWLEMKWGAEDVDTLITHYAGECDAPSALTKRSVPRQTPRNVVHFSLG